MYIFHTNDIHGRAGAASADEDGGVIGYARYKTVLDEARANVGAANVIALDAGDVTHGTNFATLSKGESMIKLMNKVGIDAMASGNHETSRRKRAAPACSPKMKKSSQPPKAERSPYLV